MKDRLNAQILSPHEVPPNTSKQVSHENLGSVLLKNVDTFEDLMVEAESNATIPAEANQNQKEDIKVQMNTSATF